MLIGSLPHACQWFENDSEAKNQYQEEGEGSYWKFHWFPSWNEFNNYVASSKRNNLSSQFTMAFFMPFIGIVA